MRKIRRLRVAIWQPLKINRLDGVLPIPVPAGVTLGCCGVNVLKAKDRGRNRRPGALTRGSLRCGGRQGSALRSDERAKERRP
jgi:hypothetical protein